MSDYQIGRDLHDLQQRVAALESRARQKSRHCRCSLENEIILPPEPVKDEQLECALPVETGFSLADIGQPTRKVVPASQVIFRPPMPQNFVREIGRKVSQGNLSWRSVSFANRPTGQIAAGIGYDTQGGGEADRSVAHLEAGFQFKCRFDRSGKLQIHTEWAYPNSLRMQFHLDDKSNFATDSGYGIRGVIGVLFRAWRDVNGPTLEMIIDSWQPLVFGGLHRCFVGANTPGNCDGNYSSSGVGPPFLGAKSDVVVQANQEMTIEIWLISELAFDSDDVTINGELSATPTVNVIVADIVP